MNQRRCRLTFLLMIWLVGGGIDEGQWLRVGWLRLLGLFDSPGAGALLLGYLDGFHDR